MYIMERMPVLNLMTTKHAHQDGADQDGDAQKPHPQASGSIHAVLRKAKFTRTVPTPTRSYRAAAMLHGSAVKLANSTKIQRNQRELQGFDPRRSFSAITL